MSIDENSVGAIRKAVEVLVQFSEFYAIDVYQRGLYNLQCRLYASTDCDGKPENVSTTARVDAIAAAVAPHAEDKAGVADVPDAPLRPSLQPDANIFSTATFLLSHEGEHIPLDGGVVFRLEVDAGATEGREDLSDGVTGDEGGYVDGMWDAWLDVELWFTADENAVNVDSLTLQQSRRFRLSHLLHPNPAIAVPHLQQYAGVNFDSVFFSACGVVVSAAFAGYTFDGLPATMHTRAANVGASTCASEGLFGWLGQQVFGSAGIVCIDGEEPRIRRRKLLADLVQSDLSIRASLKHEGEFDDVMDSAPVQAWTIYRRLIRRAIGALVDLQHCLAPAYTAYGDARALRFLPQLTTSAVLGVVRAGLRGVNASDEEKSSISIAIGVEAKSSIIEEADVIVIGWLQSRPSKKESCTRMMRVIEQLTGMIHRMWTQYGDVAMVSDAQMQALRAVWARLNYATYCRHIVSGFEQQNKRELYERIQDAVAGDRAIHSPLINEDSPNPIPIVFDLNRPLLTETPIPPESPASPVPISNRSGRAFSIGSTSLTSTRTGGRGTSLFAETFSDGSMPISSVGAQYDNSSRSLMGHHADEEASVLGLAPPKSIASADLSFAPTTFATGSMHMHEIEVALAASQHVHGGSGVVGLPSADNGGCHLWVFVHGLLGSAFDFRQYKNRITHALFNYGVLQPDLVYLISQVNEEDTLGDIDKLADALCAEILQYIEDNVLVVGKLSFVCHSLGGIIARCAIAKDGLLAYRDRLHTFTTLATPHLSVVYLANYMFHIFLGIYQPFGRSKCLDQLTLRDAPTPTSSLLYRLAKDPTNSLRAFRHIRLLASRQDGYAPFASALGEDDDRANVDTELGKAYSEMVDGFSSAVGGQTKCEKYSVWFPMLEGKSDVLGRKAHVAMLEDGMFLEMAVLINKLHL
ncbi:hypothetical protein HK104_004617 [Borealophlyctis nickersoniae]|nr:hypothetical protein HK104_004617 [Borealophlyctis nickersoniae]